jgi:hypothetical protein
MMTDIYRCAAFTIIWLGEKTDEVKEPLRYLLLGRSMLPSVSPSERYGPNKEEVQVLPENQWDSDRIDRFFYQKV